MIEQMTHVSILGKTAEKAGLLKWLYGERGFHVMPIDGEDKGWDGKFALLPDESQAIDTNLTRFNAVYSFCQEHCTNKPNFIDSMLPLKVVGSKEEIDEAVAECNIDQLYEKTADLRAAIETSNERISRLQNQKASVEQFAFLGDDLPKLANLKHFIMDVVAVPVQGGRAFLLDDRITGGKVVAEELFADQTTVYYALVVPTADADVLKGLIDEHALRAHPIPKITRGAQQEILLLNNEIMEARSVLNRQKAEANRFADNWLKKTGLAVGHYESEKNLATLRTGMTQSSHLFVTRGYVKTENLEDFKHRLEEKNPGATVLTCDAPEGEEPPTSMKWNKWISPASLLVKMYGLPAYNSIDPTPYVASLFFIFVGICLGDAVYGLVLLLLMSYLKRKYKEQAGLQDFFRCFTYCAISTIIFGILGGSWMANLTELLGLTTLDKIRTSLQVIDSIKDSQLALYIAIGIGVVSQFYGMILLVYRNLRRGDKMGAFSDGILWIGFLLFAILGAVTGSSFFWALFVLCIVGLVLTQGRDQTGWFAKIFVGLISLYGIVGSYGASAIMGDLISYARLMALNLTGAALGSTFNMLAELSAQLPIVGLIIAVLVVVCGHAMSFFLNLLGGFVHSARLIMLEFFGRFYEGGGYAYKPYGFTSDTVEMKKN